MDSGSDVCLLPTQWVDGTKLRPSAQYLKAANQTEIAVDGEAELKIVVGKHHTTAKFFASPNVQEVILGLNWLRENAVTWDFNKNQVQINSTVFPLSAKKLMDHRNRCTVTRDVTIPATSEALVSVYIVRSSLLNTDPEGEWTTVMNEPTTGLRVARSLVDYEAARCRVRVCNTTNLPLQLHEGQTISPLQRAEVLTPSGSGPGQLRNSMDLHKAIDRMCTTVDNSISDEAKEDLYTLLNEYSDIISTSEYDLGKTGVVKHEINTGTNKPFRQPLRPQARCHLPVIDRLINDMQQQGIIEPCRSEWASNIVLVKKKDGSVRFCVDYRKLNELTTKDSYPLPRINDCLDRLAGSVWYSTFDLRSGFHQVEVNDKDRDKTAFVCHRGAFRFPRMPFGLCNAPATFQRLMDLVMMGLNFEICLIYLDDIIVFSNDLPTHLERLKKLFERLREANLKIKPSKCHLLQKKVTFLGFTVSSSGVGTDPEKVAAVKNWPVPCNLRQSRAFVGLCQYYRRFVPKFSEIAAPLHALTKKNAKFVWTSQCQVAFVKLKEALVGASVLALPTEEGHFILDCDASDSAIGAVLSQVQAGVERPICYASQLYNKHEQNYNVTRKELLAVVTFVKKFRQYLLGQPFQIRTDHAALQWLKKTPEPIGQQARWLEILEEYDYRVMHRPGKNHCNADALSRRPSEMSTIRVVTRQQGRQLRSELFKPTTDQSNPHEPQDISSNLDWPEAQKADPDVRYIYDLLISKAGAPEPGVLTSKSADIKTMCSQIERLSISSTGILVRRWTDHSSRRTFWQKVVPNAYKSRIAEDMHRGLNGGHLGQRRARKRLQQRFYWPGWAKDVQVAQMRCERCATYQRATNRRQATLQTMLVGEPWERIGVDVTGPHPTSSKGNTYILTVIDHFTKWIEIFPMRNQEAATIAKLLVDRVICVHGAPLQILTDQGRNFESDLFREICQLMSIDKIRTTAYKPSTNGTIERFHSTLNSMLAKLVSDNQRDWDQFLPAVAFAYRSSIQESTGFSPYYLLYGREARIPADIVYGTPESSPCFDGYADYVVKQQNTLKDAFSLVRDNLQSAAQRRKNHYDMRVRPAQYPVGTWVYYYLPRRRIRRSRKWQRFYEGPFLVTKLLGPVNAEIQRSRQSKPIITHIDKLKLCHQPGLQSWLPEIQRN